MIHDDESRSRFFSPVFLTEHLKPLEQLEPLEPASEDERFERSVAVEPLERFERAAVLITLARDLRAGELSESARGCGSPGMQPERGAPPFEL
jgi:hypothetical protein